MTDLVTTDDNWYEIDLERLEFRIVGHPTLKQLEDFTWTWAILDKMKPWIIGTILLYAEERFGEEARYLMDYFGIDNQGTLDNIKSVVKNVPPENRRIKELDWSHHRAVRGLDKEKQAELLDKAIEGQWTTRELDFYTHRNRLPGWIDKVGYAMRLASELYLGAPNGADVTIDKILKLYKRLKEMG